MIIIDYKVKRMRVVPSSNNFKSIFLSRDYLILFYLLEFKQNVRNSFN